METLTPFYVVAWLFLVIGGGSVGAQIAVCFIGFGPAPARYSARHYYSAGSPLPNR